jgi:multiple sugar transport system permease protein
MLAAVTIVPGWFAIVVEAGFVDTYIGVIVPLVAINTALSLWLLKGFFDTVDVALEDAARMDGCSRLQIIRQIVMPISIPGILTSAIFVFIASYNAFLIPLILLSDRVVNPVTVGIYSKFGDQPIQYDVIMAMTIMALIPILLVFFYMQKYIVRGLTSGGFKGM